MTDRTAGSRALRPRRPAICLPWQLPEALAAPPLFPRPSCSEAQVRVCSEGSRGSQHLEILDRLVLCIRRHRPDLLHNLANQNGNDTAARRLRPLRPSCHASLGRIWHACHPVTAEACEVRSGMEIWQEFSASHDKVMKNWEP